MRGEEQADEIVYLVSARSGGANKRSFHTDPECRYARRARNLRKISRAKAEKRFDVCSHCAGTVQRIEEHGSYLAAQLRDVDPEDISL